MTTTITENKPDLSNIDINDYCHVWWEYSSHTLCNIPVLEAKHYINGKHKAVPGNRCGVCGGPRCPTCARRLEMGI